MIVSGLHVRYQDEGEGKCVLMLHGWMHDHHSFDALAALLTRHYRVVRLDLPGFGGSATPPSTWRVEDYAACVASFIQKLNIRPHAIIGHSFGGRIILKGFGGRLLTAERIVLIAAAGNARRSTLRLGLYRFLAKGIKLLAFIIPMRLYARLRRAAYQYLQSDYADVGALSEIFVRAISEDLTPDAIKISVPTLLLWGSADEITPLSDGECLKAAIPGARFETFPGATHQVHRERPEEVAATILAFL